MDPTMLGRPVPTPTAQKTPGLITKRTLIIVLALVGALISGTLLFASGSDNSGPLLQRLSARQATTLKLVADGQKNIISDDLAKINSELNIVLQSDNNALQAELSAAGIKKIDKLIAANEADEETFKKLASAKLNAQYDSTYRGVLAQKLESLRALLQELHDKTKSKALKTKLAAEYQHLSTYADSLDKLATN